MSVMESKDIKEEIVGQMLKSRENVKMTQPFFSIIIATYNSERTLEYTLQSIRQQSIDQNELEILVVDGGSTDRTREIAQRYGAILYNNPQRLPEYAKALGTSHANGHYVVRMDSDEEFSYCTQLQDKMEFLRSHPEIKVLIPNKCSGGGGEKEKVSVEFRQSI